FRQTVEEVHDGFGRQFFQFFGFFFLRSLAATATTRLHVFQIFDVIVIVVVVTFGTIFRFVAVFIGIQIVDIVVVGGNLAALLTTLLAGNRNGGCSAENGSEERSERGCAFRICSDDFIDSGVKLILIALG